MKARDTFARALRKYGGVFAFLFFLLGPSAAAGTEEITLPAEAAGLPLSMDVNVQGYTGKREGVSGSARIRIEF
jgi:hypothetical protein